MKRYLYFLPLLLIVSVNLWDGISTDSTVGEICFHILTMLNVGFIEEIIFRGFLFKMMEKDNLKSAIAASSITFGIGHIVNLFSGADLIPTLLQMSYAIALGYLFVVIFYRSNSLIPCIITHATINALSIFHVKGSASLYVGAVVLIVVPLVYAIYINRTEMENAIIPEK